MEEIIIDKQDYDVKAKRNYRYAARGIAFKDNKLILIQSEKFGEFKFPGGGIHENEDKTIALAREFKEETGIDIIIDSIKPFVSYKEIRKDDFNDGIFVHTSYYYLVSVFDEIGSTNMDDYEIEYGYKLVFKSLDDAIQNNQRILDKNICPWVERELTILNKLKNKFQTDL